MTYPFLNSEERVHRLEQDLENVRWTILDLLPENVKDAFERYSSCKNSKDIQEGFQKFHDETIRSASPTDATSDDDPYSNNRPRVLCPLCKRGSRNVVIHQGFLLPEGLIKHLTGENNAHQCRVVEAIMPLATGFFRPIHLAEQKARTEGLEQRKSVETLYQTAVNTEPVLIDDGLFWKHSRNEQEMSWAEQRLRELGFQVIIEGRVKKYVLEEEKLFVFADPRSVGEISFSVYQMPVPKRGRGKLLRSFSIQDKWKNDLKAKFESRLVGNQS